MRSASLASLLLVWCVPGVARALPPIAQVGASADEAAVGEPITFSSAGSSDPDGGALTFAWDFDDGSTSSEPAPTHAFTAAGAYRVRLTVSDGEQSTEAGLTVYVLAPPTPRPPARSALAVLDETRGELWTVAPDASALVVVDAETLRVRATLPIGGPAHPIARSLGAHPRALALDQARRRLLVTSGADDALWTVDLETRTATSARPLGRSPAAVALSPDGTTLVVAVAGDGSVVILDAETFGERARLDVAPEPRAIAVDATGTRAFVTHFLSRGDAGTVTVIDLAAARVQTTLALAGDPGPDSPSSGRGVPNLLGAIAIEPAGERCWVGGLKSNDDRGAFRSGEPLTPTNTVRGLLAPIDLGALAERADRRIDPNDADACGALAFSASGRWAFVAHPGAGALSVYDLAALSLFSPGRGATVPFAARVDVGDAPDEVVVAGARAFVVSTLAGEIRRLDVSDPREPRVVATATYAEPGLPDDAARGRLLFHRSRPPLHSSAGYIACASCHPEGGHDGRTWDFTDRGEGLRNTIDLRGRAGLAPLHWTANFDEVQDFENDIVHAFGGTGLAADGAEPHEPYGTPNAGRSADLDALAAYVQALDAAPAAPGRDASSVARGRALFFRDDVGCADCHTGPRYSDSTLPPVLHDVGTIGAGTGNRLGEPLTGLDTPQLLGLWQSAPYLHDGSAATLRDVLVTRNPADRHGRTSHLGAEEIADLETFLLSLDAPGAAELDPAGGGCTCAVRPGAPTAAPVLISLLVLAAAGRRAAKRRRPP